ncbi:MAG: trehalose-phosphatase [Candidatus Omnitrophica bacterium]|nr:trehalose-phosphatase [Candidatus Omnitrophota bacterium]MDD4013914.1 trehalose-phosphatase [Candidatus Omnitrophota bacterium]
MKDTVKGISKILSADKKKPLFLFLDFDGTIAPLRKRPGDAFLPRGTHRILKKLASGKNVTLVIITGRSLKDIAGRVGIKKAVYAGNHGLEIKGQGVHLSVKGLEKAKTAVKELSRVLKRKLAKIKGVIVEDKYVTISVHYRMTPDRKVPAVMESVLSEVSYYEKKNILRSSGGKKIIEIKPDVKWDKGKAALYIVKRLKAVRAGSPLVVYMGDDRTDEDAFRALGDKGITIHVGTGRTDARYSVKGTGEVRALLGALAGVWGKNEG